MSAALKENHAAPGDTACGKAPKQSSITRYSLSLISHVGYSHGISSSVSDPDRKPHSLADSKNRHQSGRANLEQTVVSSLNENIGSDIGSDLPARHPGFSDPTILSEPLQERLGPPESNSRLCHCGDSDAVSKVYRILCNPVWQEIQASTSAGSSPSHSLWRRWRP